MNATLYQSSNIILSASFHILLIVMSVFAFPFIAKVLAVSKNRTDTRIYVRGDKTINYGRVLEIMGLLSGSGFTKVALISEPLKQR